MAWSRILLPWGWALCLAAGVGAGWLAGATLASSAGGGENAEDGQPARPEPRVALQEPGLAAWQPTFAAAPERSAKGRVARAERHLAPIYRSTRSGSLAGRLRAGAAVPAHWTGRRCQSRGERGFWYATEGGYICGAGSMAVVRDPPADTGARKAPAAGRYLPYRYAKVEPRGAPIFRRRPSAQELEAAVGALAEGTRLPGPTLPANGAYWLALDEEREIGGRPVWRTVDGDWVLDEHLDHRAMPTMRGELLGGDTSLPLAFAHHEDGAGVECPGPEATWVPCGHVETHARFAVQAVQADGSGEVYVVSKEGWRVPRDRVRVAERSAPPKAKLSRARWVHIDLDEQTLVAYEGETPVFATLVSSGKGERFATPAGLFRVQRKYLTKTMKGPDPDVGRYHIEEIPWALYYHRGYAVHGAYWHDIFGNTRSHGCTNVAPPDARWLYFWSTPEVPAGWHAVVGARGTWFWFTREEA